MEKSMEKLKILARIRDSKQQELERLLSVGYRFKILRGR